MAMIGIFTVGKDGGWTGTVRTLTIEAKIRLVPNDNKESENAPAFRVFAGRSRIGDAWRARTAGTSPKDYLRVRIDDPSLPEPMNAALFPSQEGNTAELVWSRRREGSAR